MLHGSVCKGCHFLLSLDSITYFLCMPLIKFIVTITIKTV